MAVSSRTKADYKMECKPPVVLETNAKNSWSERRVAALLCHRQHYFPLHASATHFSL